MDQSSHLQLRQAVSGDRGAISSLLEAHAAELRRTLQAELDPSWQFQIEIDDVLQVTYLEAFLRIGQFTSGPDSFRSWLVQIGRNNLLDAIKELTRAKRPDHRKRVLQSDTGSCHELLDLLSASVTTPDQRAARQELVGIMTAAIQTLPTSYSQVVEMYDLQGRSAAEVGSVLGRSEGAVYMLRARAHDRLRELLGFNITASRV